jgi:hypothetical protein
MIMRKLSIVPLVVLLALAGGCNQKSSVAANEQTPPAASAQQQPATTAAAAHELTPEQLGQLGAQIRKTPERATELLTQAGLTQQSFEAQIRKTTENAEASRRYAEAYRKASA